jgi:GAF domain-containing protein
MLRHVAVLAKTVGGAVSVIQPDEFLARVAQRAMEIVGAHSATIHIYADLEVIREASAGKAAKLDFITRFPPHKGGIGEAARKTGDVVQVNEPDVRKNYPDLYEIGVRTMAAFPLTLADRREGVLYLHFFDRPHEFSPAEIAVVKSVVGSIEGAILSRQLLDEIAESAKWGWMVAGQHPVIQSLIEPPDLPLVMESLVQKLRLMFGAKSVVLYRYDQSRDSFREVASTEVSTWASKNPGRDSAANRLLRQFGETQYFQDAQQFATQGPGKFAEREGIRSCAAVVLRATKAAEIAGVMFVNYGARNEFSYDTRQAIDALGASAAIAIGTARLHDRANRELAGWTRVARALTKVDDLIAGSLQNPQIDEILKLILEESIEMTGASDGVIYLLHPHDQKLAPSVTHGFEGLEVKPQNLGEGIVGQAASGKRSIRLDDVHQHKDYIETKPETQSELAVPLRYRGDVLGVINLEDPKREFFREDQEAWLETLAMQGVIAIRSLESFRMWEARLRAFGEVTGRLQRNPHDLRTALHLVLTGITAKQGLSFTRALLFSVDPEAVEGILAVGPSDGTEADKNWKELERMEEAAATGRISLEELLNRAEQYEREIALGYPAKALDAKTRKLGFTFISPSKFEDLSRITADVIERNKEHPARALLKEVVAEEDASEEFAVVPLYETHDKVVALLVVDRAYQSAAEPIQNADLKNLEAFGELAALAFKMERLRGKLSDPHRQQEWDEFIGDTMHTVTSEVNNAKNCVSLVRAGGLNAFSHEQRTLLNMVRDYQGWALEAANRVSEYARPLGTLHKVDLGALTMDVVAEDPSIVYKIDPEPVIVIGSAVRLRDALRNVIINAQEAAKRNGRVGEIEVVLSRVKEEGRDFAWLEVRDQAGGMPEGLAEKVKKGYYSPIKEDNKSIAGSKRGLGLPIVKKVATGYGGWLRIEPLEGGTNVIIRLPALAIVGESLDANASVG